MRQFFYVLIAVIGLAQAAPAQTGPEAEIENTIQSQLDAFLADDFVAAFDYAAPNIQGMFRTPQNFEMMVKRGYPMVWRPDDVTFGDLRADGAEMAQRVIIRDQKGETHVLEYRLVDQGGMWRISGVQILPQPGVSA
ncbi:DUF4864 domain-containing protein [Thalassococcus profundi]|uniref:DUF4864 domain-containing protein n=1 Tax=Thalassococcus profundi TaxID=2282382 RepID=A0A369TL88_9RHOB|nr:DUF4864 domain-containing protein [Thalassococcus profundi]RDD65592.1 DUF4864 domain-containing protein [Thalassococcus profundi]